MINNKLQNYRGKLKVDMCKMIVERKKHENLDKVMYGEDFDDGTDGDNDDSDDVEVEVVRKKLKRLSKGAKPREISDEGSLYRLMSNMLMDSPMTPLT
jgi:hypothetical protein